MQAVKSVPPVPSREEMLRILLEYPAALAAAVGLNKIATPMHNRWMCWMIRSSTDLTILAHRGAYKTTCAAVAMAILMLTRPRSNIIFMRKTEDDVVEVLRLVRMILEHTNCQFVSEILYGTSIRIFRADQHSLTTTCYQIMRGAPQLLGIGIGGSITGKHADFIFTDDIVNITDLQSAAERRHTCRIYQELQNIRNPGGRVVNTGTPWHPDDAVHNMPNPTIFSWRDTHLLTPAQVQTLRADLDPATFAANYDLKCIASADAVVQTPPKYFDDPDLLTGGIVHIDAAYGGKDGTALTILQNNKEHMCVFGKLWQKSIHQLIDEIAAIHERFGASTIFIETNGDKGWAAQLLREAGLPVRTYHEYVPKYLKIVGELHKWWPTIMFLSSTDDAYVAQILDFCEDSLHDDAPDSLASALRHRNRRFHS